MLRVMAFVAALFTGLPIALYIVAWLMIPENEAQQESEVTAQIHRSNARWLVIAGLMIVAVTIASAIHWHW
jgi:hypothetical protein